MPTSPPLAPPLTRIPQVPRCASLKEQEVVRYGGQMQLDVLVDLLDTQYWECIGIAVATHRNTPRHTSIHLNS